MAKLEYAFDAGRPGLLVAVLRGDIDTANARELADAFHGVAKDDGMASVAWDLSDVKLLASSGLRVFMESYQFAKSRGGKVFVVGASAHIERTLKVTGLLRFLNVAASLEDCS